jgi:hypothetical protein
MNQDVSLNAVKAANAAVQAVRDQFRKTAPLGTAPTPDSTEPEFDVVFDAWAKEVVAHWNRRFPMCKPFDYARFDGCTAVRDRWKHLCLRHDLAYHFRLDRRSADTVLRNAILKEAEKEHEPWSRAMIRAEGWAWYWGVRLFGGKAWKSHEKNGPPS